MLFEALIEKGFEVECHSHAEAILRHDFPEAVCELENALANATIPMEEIIAGGGGEAKGTQRLRRSLSSLGWVKTTFTVEKRINDVPRESQSHEVDHVRSFGDGMQRVALEIEWNNKDPFFDRDLENFKRLHGDGAISVGVIVTRGKSLHLSMRQMVRRFLDENGIDDLDQLQAWGFTPTTRQRLSIGRGQNQAKAPLTFREAATRQFVADKFGEATTHWRKLEDRVRRGVGNPCPLVLIGLPSTIVTFRGVTAAQDDAADE